MVKTYCPRIPLQGQAFRALKAISLIMAIGLGLASCANQENKGVASRISPAADIVAQSEQATPNAADASPKAALPRPQLIKSAEISLQVKSIEESSKVIAEIVRQQQGDILELNDFRAGNSVTAQSVSLKIRVPQDRLDLVLEALSQLGLVKGRFLKAEDVTNQLVDLQARLKNSRQTEVQLQEILKQTGSVGDVLKVTQELSRVRESIEQVDAHLTNLKNQVAYSTVQVSLTAEVSVIAPQSDLGSQLQNTWNNATHSVTVVSIGLLKLSIWLMVYCPYWLIPLAGFLFLRHRRRQLTKLQDSNSPINSDN
ncbi:DUF4349 domain-containing protein [Pseudanabaena sp. 'Roaring Creek']|uniref:DUF4349 domain-containing protein n=1 Tax=Pseudanabaena sp. 'Roaring Creek' TaxID=1681830 RepID=UPI0006D7D45C|nr:DUF4349 domain-containing protein [Pseudanabaena sp. 'Roaring Creek']